MATEMYRKQARDMMYDIQTISFPHTDTKTRTEILNALRDTIHDSNAILKPKTPDHVVEAQVRRLFGSI